MEPEVVSPENTYSGDLFIIRTHPAFKTIRITSFVLILLAVASLVTLLATRNTTVMIIAAVALIICGSGGYFLNNASRKMIKREKIGEFSLNGFFLFSRQSDGHYDETIGQLIKFSDVSSVVFDIRYFSDYFYGKLTIIDGQGGTSTLAEILATEQLLKLKDVEPKLTINAPYGLKL
ncbi:MAG TPA: hypothetical protein PKC96_02535 [Bacilli bacterium]|nr:hypothetical protein [Bacilli bacterium]